MVQKKKPSVGPGTHTIRGVVDGSIPARVPEDSDPRLHARCADSATKSHLWPLPTSFPGPSMGVTPWITVLTIQSTYFYRLGKQTSPKSRESQCQTHNSSAGYFHTHSHGLFDKKLPGRRQGHGFAQTMSELPMPGACCGRKDTGGHPNNSF